jgi:hypothetical protein
MRTGKDSLPLLKVLSPFTPFASEENKCQKDEGNAADSTANRACVNLLLSGRCHRNTSVIQIQMAYSQDNNQYSVSQEIRQLAFHLDHVSLGYIEGSEVPCLSYIQVFLGLSECQNQRHIRSVAAQKGVTDCLGISN